MINYLYYDITVVLSFLTFALMHSQGILLANVVFYVAANRFLLLKTCLNLGIIAFITHACLLLVGILCSGFRLNG